MPSVMQLISDRAGIGASVLQSVVLLTGKGMLLAGQQRHCCPLNAALIPGTAASAVDKLHPYIVTEPTFTCHLQKSWLAGVRRGTKRGDFCP